MLEDPVCDRNGRPFIQDMMRLAREQEQGWIEPLLQAGIRIITDTCTYFSPAVNGLRGKIMTNSAKWAYYAPGMLPVEVVIGSLQECVESAVAGEVRLDSWETA